MKIKSTIICLITVGMIAVSTAAKDIPLTVPGADILVKVDMDNYSRAPIYKQFKAIFDKFRDQAAAANEQAGEQKQKADAVMQALGITEDDITGFFMAADLDDVMAAAATGAPPAFNKIQAVMVMDLAKPVSIAKIKAAFKLMDAENKNAVISETTVNGIQVLKLSNTRENAPEQSMLISVVDSGKRVIAGPETGLVSALSLSGVKAAAALSPEMQAALKSMPAKLQAWNVIVIPQAAREQIAAAAAANQNPMNPANLFRNLQSLGMFSNAAETMNFAVQFNMGEVEEAEALKNYLQIQALPMINMGLMMAGGGQPMPMATSFKVVSSGKAVRLSGSMNAADIKVLEKIMQQTPLLQGGAGGGGLPLPLPLPR